MTFLSEPTPSAEVQAKYDADVANNGFVMNLMHLWAHLPEAHTRFLELQGLVWAPFSPRERGILIAATASTIGDSYCSWAWGWKLTTAAGDPAIAPAVLAGTDAGLTPREAALADWARKVAHGASATTQADVDALRAAGLTDEDIFRATLCIGLRMAFSTVNGALGAAPDAQLEKLAPPAVGEIVTWGRPIDAAS